MSNNCIQTIPFDNDTIKISGKCFDIDGYYLAQANAREATILSRNDRDKQIAIKRG